MTKKDLINEIVKKTGFERIIVQKIVEAFMESIKDSINKKNNVYLRGFGSFILKKRAKKIARNISKNKTIIIPEHFVPAFLPARIFKRNIINTHTPIEEENGTDDTGPRLK